MLICLGLFILCGQTMDAQTKMERKSEEYRETRELIDSGNFTFEARTLRSSAGTGVSLATNDGHIRFGTDGVDIHLPYFGEGRLSTGYPGGGPIRFVGSPERYKVQYNDTKRRIRVKFSVPGKFERHYFTLRVNRSGFADVVVRSMSRTSISFYGKIKASRTSSTRVGR